MTLSRTRERWTTIAALFVLISQILLLSRPAGAAVEPDLLAPTPLVLKDGRIANVSIHVLPFDHGQGELVGDAATQLRELTGQVATDCFLTAQVIGHVSSSEVAENETLAAHRLARSRADGVQASLIGGGLPATAIASVWDWQFLVREPRATLWVFRLVQGEDCEGQPLQEGSMLVAEGDGADQADPSGAAGISSPQVAEAPPPAEPTEHAARQDEPVMAQAPADAEPAATPDVPAVATADAPETPAPATESDTSGPGLVASAVAAESQPQQAEPQPVEVNSEAATPSPAEPTSTAPAARDNNAEQAMAEMTEQERERAARPAGPATGTVPTVTRPLPAISPAQPTGDAMAMTAPATSEPAEQPQADAAGKQAEAEPTAEQQATAAEAPAETVVAAVATKQDAKQDPERDGRVEWGGDGNIVITFATNSSYFPPGTTRRLRSMVGGMKNGDRYKVELQVGVSGSDKVVGAKSPEEAKRYNRWLAERRLNRVRAWLDENATGQELEIEPSFQADDSSRRVVVRVEPVS